MCKLVPTGGVEPPRTMSTTPSRWRVYQFHHVGWVKGLSYKARIYSGRSGKSLGVGMAGAVSTVSVIAADSVTLSTGFV